MTSQHPYSPGKMQAIPNISTLLCAAHHLWLSSTPILAVDAPVLMLRPASATMSDGDIEAEYRPLCCTSLGFEPC